MPEPDCPHMNVCRDRPPLSRRSGTPGERNSSPIRRPARPEAPSAVQAATSAGVAGRTLASWNGSSDPSRTVPAPVARLTRTVAAPVLSSAWARSTVWLSTRRSVTCPSRLRPEPSRTT